MKLQYLALRYPNANPAELLAKQRLAASKNKNRQAAALRRVRDNNGKFQGLSKRVAKQSI
jgi:hypothetical protein